MSKLLTFQGRVKCQLSSLQTALEVAYFARKYSFHIGTLKRLSGEGRWWILNIKAMDKRCIYALKYSVDFFLSLFYETHNYPTNFCEHHNSIFFQIGWELYIKGGKLYRETVASTTQILTSLICLMQALAEIIRLILQNVVRNVESDVEIHLKPPRKTRLSLIRFQETQAVWKTLFKISYT
jgi:hypothetical protein